MCPTHTHTLHPTQTADAAWAAANRPLHGTGYEKHFLFVSRVHTAKDVIISAQTRDRLSQPN